MYYRIGVALAAVVSLAPAANHVHTVVRDPANDFGEDALREHYRKHKHGK